MDLVDPMARSSIVVKHCDLVWRHRLNADYPLIVLEGINDVGQGRANPLPSAADLLAGHRQRITRAPVAGR